MSFSTSEQLRSSYARIIDATLKQVRSSGVLHEAGRDTVDELGRRWRAAVEHELRLMECGHPDRFVAPSDRRAKRLALEDIAADDGNRGRALEPGNVVPKSLLEEQRPYRAMDCVTWAEPFKLPTAVASESRPSILSCRGGYRTSHVDAPDGPVPGFQATGSSQSLLSQQPLGAVGAVASRKRQRADGGHEQLEPGVDSSMTMPEPLAPPLLARRENEADNAAPQLLSLQAAQGEDSEDEYAGCFDDAEVIAGHVETPSKTAALASTDGPDAEAEQGEDGPSDAGPSAKRRRDTDADTGAVVADQDSSGSELGSDLDDSEFEEPPTNNMLFADIAQVKRHNKKWIVEMRHGFLQVDGIECLFASARGTFKINDDVAPAPPPLLDEGDISDGEGILMFGALR